MLIIFENVASGFRDIITLLSPLEIVGMLISFISICFFQSFFTSKKLG